MLRGPMSDAEIVVLSQPGCHRCVGVGRHLTTRGIPHEVVDVTEDVRWREWLDSLGINSVPVTVRTSDKAFVHEFQPDAIVKLATDSTWTP